MTIRERVKKLCEDNDISVNKFEQELGFSKGYISKLDNSTPNSRFIKKMADYFGVTTDYILYGNVSEVMNATEFSEVEKRLVEYYRRLDAFNQGQIMGYMRGLLLEGDSDDSRRKN